MYIYRSVGESSFDQIPPELFFAVVLWRDIKTLQNTIETSKNEGLRVTIILPKTKATFPSKQKQYPQANKSNIPKQTKASQSRKNILLGQR